MIADWLQNIRVDGFSFFLGLAAGTIFWVLFNQFKGWIPRLQTILKQLIRNFRERNFAGVEAAIRLDALKRSEKSHLAASLFPLDDILILPKLISLPPSVDPAHPTVIESIIADAFPYLPDWPELAAQYGVNYLSLAQAIQQGANLVIVGQLGCGKSTALAHLAVQLARKDPLLGPAQSDVPFYLHIQDILPQLSENPERPLQVFIKAITNRLPIFAQNQMPGFTKLAIPDGKIILLLDGLDELSIPTFKEVVKNIKLLLKENSTLQCVTTSSAIFLDGLVELGFCPLTIAPWNLDERADFIQKWGKLWQERITPEIKRRSDFEQIEPVFVNNWVSPKPISLTPLEWTLSLWSIYSGQNGLSTPLAPLSEFIQRCLVDPILFDPMSVLALKIVKGNRAYFDQEDLDSLSENDSFVQMDRIGQENSPVENQDNRNTKTLHNKPLVKTTPWMSDLLQTGLVIEHAGKIFRFCHPAVLAYLAAAAGSEMDRLDLLSAIESSEICQLTLAYFCSIAPEKLVVPNDWLQGTAPLYRKSLMVGRWARYIPMGHPMRAKVLKRLVDGVLDDTALYSIRFRFCTALAISNDPSLPVIFKQLLSSTNEKVLSLALLSLGALQEEKTINQMAALLANQADSVRRDACIAISAMRTKIGKELMVECLSADDEILRKASAESLAGLPLEGHEILINAAQSENLLVRRSVMFGLARIRQPWAVELLQKIAVEDGQWVVRSAASEALDILQKPDINIPSLPIAPSESPWLLSFASKLGQGISPGDLAEDLLIKALQSGNDDEKIAALTFLRQYSEEQVIAAIIEAAYQAEEAVSNAAQLALWYASCIQSENFQVKPFSIRKG